MIGSLRGQVLERDLAGSVLIEVGGVGYVVNVSARALAELEPSTPAFLYVHHHIREDTATALRLSHPRRAGHVPDADRHPRGRAGAGDGDHRHPPAACVGRHRRRR